MKTTKIESQWIEVTPKRAEELLATNIRNRPLSENHVRDLVAAMKGGKWGTTAEALMMDTSGALIDGQHRLTAVVRSGTTQKFLLITGAPVGSFRFMGRAKIRNASDILGMLGDTNTVVTAATYRWLETYEARGVNRRGSGLYGDRLMEVRASWPKVAESVHAAATVRRQAPWLTQSMVAGVHALIARYGTKEAADKYVLDLATGANLSPTDPIYKLRETMINNAASRQKFSPNHLFKLAIKAWNLRAAGRAPTNLRLREDEGFPIMAGDKA